MIAVTIGSGSWPLWIIVPGLAMLVYGLVRGDRELAGDGFRTLLVGVGLFLGFAFFFEGVIELSGHRIANLDAVLPYVVIGFGVLLVVSSLLGGGNRDRRHRRDQQA
jgi:drug/metabolite transporter (DMT)-like permease